MIYTWHESDVKAGQWAANAKDPRKLLCIGYRHTEGDGEQDSVEYGIVCIGTDGWFQLLGNKEAVAKFLTEGNWEPVDKAKGGE